MRERKEATEGNQKPCSPPGEYAPGAVTAHAPEAYQELLNLRTLLTASRFSLHHTAAVRRLVLR
jgi:hypothetical protein